MTDETTETPIEPPTEHELRAVKTLKLLGDAERQKVLQAMDPAARARVDQLMAQDDTAFSMDLEERRRLMRETATQIYVQRIKAAETVADSGDLHVAPAAPGATHPLDQLRQVHPAALARAMQGERAEAWALVLERLEPNAQSALRMYLDEDARVAIETARTHQLGLAPQVRNTIERAIAQTIVPAALREHARLLTSNGTGGPAAAFA